MTKAKPQALVSSDPAANQQARSDAAAELDPAMVAVQGELTETLAALTASGEENDKLRKQIADSSEALAATQREAAGLKVERDAIGAELQKTVESLEAATAAARSIEVPDDARLHAMWTDAGGDHGRFETAKRFAQALLAG